jgi:Outer membrane protein beta-barrel domain
MMRKLNLVLLLIALTIVSINSKGQFLSLGLKCSGDLTYLNQTARPTLPFNPVYKYVPSFQVGLFGKFQINNAIGLAVEPGFIQKGARNSNSNYNVRLGYIDMPVILFYVPIKNLNIEIGPEFGYRIYWKVDGNSKDLPYTKKDLSAIIGLSYDLNNRINFGSRYSYSLTNWDTSIVTNSIQTNLVSNRYFEFFVKYSLLKI